jgi:hypothetical protein
MSLVQTFSGPHKCCESHEPAREGKQGECGRCCGHALGHFERDGIVVVVSSSETEKGNTLSTHMRGKERPYRGGKNPVVTQEEHHASWPTEMPW